MSKVKVFIWRPDESDDVGNPVYAVAETVEEAVEAVRKSEDWSEDLEEKISADPEIHEIPWAEWIEE